MKIITLAAMSLLAASTSAYAQPVVDGVGSTGEYAGASSVTVATDPNAPNGNFGNPGLSSEAGYTINLTDQSGLLFGLVSQTGGTAIGPFTNLYFDLDSATRSGSDLGFEIGPNGVRAFVPENGSASVLDASLYNFASTTTNGLLTVEFRLDNSLFTNAIAGLNYNPALNFGGSLVRLNLSQTLGYSVAGGQANFGSQRLGTFTVGAEAGAVPEPATWAMMLLGFGAIGMATRRRRKTAGQLQAA